VLHEVQDDFTEAGRDEIRSVAEKDVTARSGANVGIGELVCFIFGDGFV
jgi:hypothetical protein